MVVLVAKYGGHSNRLFQVVRIESFCREHGIAFHNPSFWDMEKIYSTGAWPTWLSRLFVYLVWAAARVRLLSIARFDDESKIQEYGELMQAKQILLVSGWEFQDKALIRKHRDHFVRKFTPVQPSILENELVVTLDHLKRSGVALFGMHIRKNDYRDWRGGDFHYDDAWYADLAAQIHAFARDRFHNDYRIVVFSDEEVVLPIDERILISKNDWPVDHLAMSKCDFLVGPPSTFTLWASFMGRAKYAHVYSKSFRLSDESFSVDI